MYFWHVAVVVVRVQADPTVTLVLPHVLLIDIDLNQLSVKCLHMLTDM